MWPAALVEVSSSFQQKERVHALRRLFTRAKVIDRRENPSNGYRAVHVVVTVLESAVELQVRTALQHRWAEWSEKFADEFGQDLKYGGGPEVWRNELLASSDGIAKYEACEMLYADIAADLKAFRSMGPAEFDDLKQQLVARDEKMISTRDSVDQRLQRLVSRLELYRRDKQ